MMRTLPPDKDLRLIPVCRSYDSSARTIFGHNKTAEDLIRRGVTEQKLGQCQPLAEKPLFAISNRHYG